MMTKRALYRGRKRRGKESNDDEKRNIPKRGEEGEKRGEERKKRDEESFPYPLSIVFDDLIYDIQSTVVATWCGYWKTKHFLLDG